MSARKKRMNNGLLELGDNHMGDLNENCERGRYFAIEEDKTDEEERIIKKRKAMQRIKELLKISEKFSSYYVDKLAADRKATEKERVQNMMDQKSSTDANAILKELKYFKGELRDYQIYGIFWLTTLYKYGVNGILADEMGLGKTVQVIALICHLLEKDVKRPFLIIAPLSTIPNWSSEFKRFAPDVPVITFHGDAKRRNKLSHDLAKIYEMDNKSIRPVILTTKEMFSMELETFKTVKWVYVIIDEAHCIKSVKTALAKNVRYLQCDNKLLLTGTPLQNNMEELWSLLNFIMPSIFKDMETFSSLLMLSDLKKTDKLVDEEKSNNVISTICKVIEPFMLRRLKSEVLSENVPKKQVIVYCPMSKMQRMLYIYVLEKNIAALSGKTENTENEEPPAKRLRKIKSSYNVDKYKFEDYLVSVEDDSIDRYQTVKNGESVHKRLIKIKDDNGKIQHFVTQISYLGMPMMMYKKIVDHPFLVHIPVTPNGREFVLDERIITESGKMQVLDAMLKQLKKDNHKVLLYSTLTMMLDLIEEMLDLKGYKHCRLDGHTKLANRETCIDKFSNDPEIFIFLLSTRAAGLGLNLIAADTVIFYDNDWNPQVDLQAQDRCHRIGQTKPVMVFSLVTKNTVDERIITRGEVKRRLEKVIIKNDKFRTMNEGNRELNLDELKELLEKVEAEKVYNNGKIYSTRELNKILDRSDLYKQMEKMNAEKNVDK